MKTQFLLLGDVSDELTERLERNDSIQCTASVHLAQTPNFGQYRANGLLSPAHIQEINTSLESALTCTSDTSEFPGHELEITAQALQLVKPTRGFCKYYIEVDDQRGIQQATTDIQLLHGVIISDPYLRYQQHHTITASDMDRAINLLSTLFQVMGQEYGSWRHPFGSVHRAVVFFAQGYSVGLPVLRQVLWAAGLDCLFASKLNRRLQRARTISRRLQHLFDPGFDPYSAETVVVPPNQQRSQMRLEHIGEHILWLRNAYMHGSDLDASWLLNQEEPEEAGYAYQLCECTEILLRTTLLKILENPTLLETFKDPERLDNYFDTA